MASLAEKLALSEELLEDIETNRLRGQPLVLKATRLARMLENEGLQKFLRWELHGYPEDDPAANDMLAWTGRRGWDEQNATYRTPLARLLDWGDEQAARLAAITGREASGEWAFAVTQGDKRERAQILPTVNRIRGIESAVVAWIHEMVAQISFELAFSTRQSAVFDEAQRAIDSRLAATGGRALERIEAIYERLADPENTEAISQARDLPEAHCGGSGCAVSTERYAC